MAILLVTVALGAGLAVGLRALVQSVFPPRSMRPPTVVEAPIPPAPAPQPPVVAREEPSPPTPAAPEIVVPPQPPAPPLFAPRRSPRATTAQPRAAAPSGAATSSGRSTSSSTAAGAVPPLAGALPSEPSAPAQSVPPARSGADAPPHAAPEPPAARAESAPPAVALPAAPPSPSAPQPVEIAQQPPAAPSQRARPSEPGILADENRWRVLEPGGIATKPRNPLYDPYNPNLLKGDFPVFGDKTFLAVAATLDAIADFKRNLDFFQSGRIRNVPFHEHNTVTQLTGVLALELFHGDTVFAPKDWAVRLTPIVRWRCGDKNAIDQGCGEDIRMLEAFGEAKLFEVGETFDATSARAGLQFFNSDFFGFVYNDVQPGARLFGELARNQYKFNVAAFDRLNKEKLSGLNEFKRREHQVGVASFQWDDFLFPGFNILPSFVYSHDDILAGTLNAYYVGATTNGRLGRFNVNSAMYYVFGDTARNTPSGKSETISAGMAFAQVAYPTRYYVPRLAAAFATGDRNVDDRRANGFDSVFDNVAFGGGQFSYLFGEKVQLGAVTVLRGNSIFPSLRGANATGQFVNPGIIALNPGIDVALTPKTIFEANYDIAWFDTTAPLERLIRRKRVSTLLGHEANAGFTYRPFLNEQVIIFAGGAVFVPGRGINDTFGTDKTVYKALMRVILSY